MMKIYALCLLVVAAALHSTAAQTCGAILDSLPSRLSALETEVSTLRAQLRKQAAFSARFDGSNNDLNIGSTDPIRFPTVITNIGNGYNPQTGYFTAQYPGIYAFYFHMRSTNTHSPLVVTIYKDNEELLGATADGSDKTWNRGNVLVTTHLNAGQRVYCRQTWGSTWLEGGFLTNFSGFLVQADSE